MGAAVVLERDWFDLGNVTAVSVEMIKADVLSDGMRRLERAASGEPLPGYHPRGESPVPLWGGPA
ncbi:hypothetical protein Acsp04_15450 [Actinomadura sp. NBRC 104425]|uniref:hypothetical protein n=1 Tax=Actinomadura sp. NBRC 104425 TaxID=3032204 RepID=UPI0024A3E962|nr:hypothetical protein [Actinomadura sp. NBRC 104425]GLZ11310.1 hypothetical protein Acsp04_15450 [Actinomadura sp. NBRC 104425]